MAKGIKHYKLYIKYIEKETFPDISIKPIKREDFLMRSEEIIETPNTLRFFTVDGKEVVLMQSVIKSIIIDPVYEEKQNENNNKN